MTPKAQSVTLSGEPDGFLPPRAWRSEVFGDGHTRLVVSVPAEELQSVHLGLLGLVEGPWGVRYVQLTNRLTGQLPAPEGRVAMGVAPARALAVLKERPTLVWADGRHQLWVRGALGETVILDEMGVIYLSPDDPMFRDALTAFGIPESNAPTMDSRDYVKVAFHAEADAEETSLWESLKMLRWK